MWFTGENNHQFGLKGSLNSSFKGEVIEQRNNSLTERMVYMPEHPCADKNGRIREHRLVVENNKGLFSGDWFEEINGVTVLKKDAVVHHKDGNHNNNDVNNLEIVSRGEHTAIHNKIKPMPRSKETGQFKKRERNDA